MEFFKLSNLASLVIAGNHSLGQHHPSRATRALPLPSLEGADGVVLDRNLYRGVLTQTKGLDEKGEVDKHHKHDVEFLEPEAGPVIIKGTFLTGFGFPT